MAHNAIIRQAIDNETKHLEELSGRIWSKPELAYKEQSAHDNLADFLEGRGFTVERNYKIQTAFRGVFQQGTGGAHVVVICEYDALPDIGHACGHNLIAEAGVAAGLAIKVAMEKDTSVNGTLTVLGTPAEEAGGGKIDLIRAGALQGVDVALMAHPDKTNMMAPIIVAYDNAMVTFTGRAAHAAAAPWEGVNALDAAVNAYTALSMLRQQTKTTCRMHAVILEGGTRPNIIPEKTVMKYTVRAATMSDLAVLKEKTLNIMKASALATGCEVEVKFDAGDRVAHYESQLHNPELLGRFQSYWEGFGPESKDTVPARVWASTDMGNVSHVVPSIHPTFSIGTLANIHTREFTEAAMQAPAHTATRCVAKAMACVGWDVLTDCAYLQRVKKTFQEQLKAD